MAEITPGETAYLAYWPALGSVPPVAWAGLRPVVQAAWEAAAQAVRAVPRTFAEKSALNQWAAARYDALMQEGKHGHYETMFRVIHEALARQSPTLLVDMP